MVTYSQKVPALTMNYGLDINSNTKVEDDKVYINPFHKLKFTDDTEYLDENYLTEIDSFDGANKATLGTNENMFSRTYETKGDGYVVNLNT